MFGSHVWVSRIYNEVLKQYADYCRDKLKKPLASFQFDAEFPEFSEGHSLKRQICLAIVSRN